MYLFPAGELTRQQIDYIKIVDYFAAKYGWSKEQTFQLTSDEINQLYVIISKRERQEARKHGNIR